MSEPREDIDATGSGRRCRVCRHPARATPAHAQGTVKIGVIMSYSGQFADTGAQIDNGIKLYMKQHGDTVAGKKIEIIRKDTGGIAPDVAKRLSQEVIVRDKVDILAGFDLTPNALAAADVSAQAKKFMVNMNAATSIITTKSPYMVRTSFTRAAAQRAARHLGLQERRAQGLHAGLRLRPGPRRRSRVPEGFKDAGGEIIGSARYPGRQPGLHRLRAARQGHRTRTAIYIWVPGGTQPAAIGKAIAERGIDPNKIKIIGQGELTYRGGAEEHGRRRRSASSPPFHYDYNHQSAMNKEFVGPTTPTSSAIPTCSRSAAMTACTSSTRR